MTREQVRDRMRSELCDGLPPEDAQRYERVIDTTVDILFSVGPEEAAEVIRQVAELLPQRRQ